MKSGKWANQIVSRQLPDGSWGRLHSMSQGNPLTTEKALRRLWELGLTTDDTPIQHALDYLHQVLAHKTVPPDCREKVLN